MEGGREVAAASKVRSHARKLGRARVFLLVQESVEEVLLAGDGGYRQAPDQEVKVTLTARELVPIPPGSVRLPTSPAEVQWIIAWSLRFAVVAVTVVIAVVALW